MPRKLTANEIKALKKQGCSAEDWKSVTVDKGFQPARAVQCVFSGRVHLGDNRGSLRVDGVEYPCGTYHAVLHNTEVGPGALVRNIGTHVSNYIIEQGAAVVNTAGLSAEKGAAFGHGVQAETLNEAGGREVPLSASLTSQIAYLFAVYRYRPKTQAALSALFGAEAKKLKGQKGRVQKGARVVNCGPVQDVWIGPHASVRGAASLKDGFIKSCKADPAVVGEGVTAGSFVFLEGAHVTSQAVLHKVFAGQGARIGKQYSAENSLFFANCEGFHGEACSIFAGPYSVTHHKSTLLIASLYSFYNAGSGTNQSNHMYKLGPVHQGILARGCKTGSFSYLLFECNLAPFCVVIGKHMAKMDIPDFPFSYLFDIGGKSHLTPAMNLLTVGTVRDQEKWASRDRRKAPDKADLINPLVYSPDTVEKMIRGRDILKKLHEETPRDMESLNVGGANLSSLLLKKGAKHYGMAVRRYLCQKFFARVAPQLKKGLAWQAALEAVKPKKQAFAEWVDLCGMLCPREPLADLLEDLDQHRIKSIDKLRSALSALHAEYAEYEWAYVYDLFRRETGVAPGALAREKALEMVEEWRALSRQMQGLVLADAEKEFDVPSQIGYGLDGAAGDLLADFTAVRGTRENNKVLVSLRKQADEFTRDVEALKGLIQGSQ
jgi:hypothetical protein